MHLLIHACIHAPKRFCIQYILMYQILLHLVLYSCTCTVHVPVQAHTSTVQVPVPVSEYCTVYCGTVGGLVRSCCQFPIFYGAVTVRLPRHRIFTPGVNWLIIFNAGTGYLSDESCSDASTGTVGIPIPNTCPTAKTRPQHFWQRTQRKFNIFWIAIDKKVHSF